MFYPNFPIFLHRYIFHICDISQLCPPTPERFSQFWQISLLAIKASDVCSKAAFSPQLLDAVQRQSGFEVKRLRAGVAQVSSAPIQYPSEQYSTMHCSSVDHNVFLQNTVQCSALYCVAKYSVNTQHVEVLTTRTQEVDSTEIHQKFAKQFVQIDSRT